MRPPASIRAEYEKMQLAVNRGQLSVAEACSHIGILCMSVNEVWEKQFLALLTDVISNAAIGEPSWGSIENSINESMTYLHTKHFPHEKVRMKT